jgi:hypothetical protein
MEPSKLQEHMLYTYKCLRYGAGIIAFGFPILVYVYGKFCGIELQNSISAYYWADMLRAPVRVWFIGVLFSLASLFYVYKGYSEKENIAFNLAAVFAIGVAYFPMPWGCGALCPKFTVHGFCAFALFACLVYVIFRRSGDTLDQLDDPDQIESYKTKYRRAAIAMTASPVVAFLWNLWFGREDTYTFFIETAGIWAFAYYWWIKNQELERSSAVKKSLGLIVKA